MMILVLGKNNSGKSLYAESIACSLARRKLYYVATMMPYGEEGLARISKHRIQRQNKNFITLEAPYADAITDNTGTALLEDISNLIANLMFEKKVSDVETETLLQIKKMRSSLQNLIVVSISGYDKEDANDSETQTYIQHLYNINMHLWDMADVVIEMISGAPIVQKGELSWR